jgi:hypothetical protein
MNDLRDVRIRLGANGANFAHPSDWCERCRTPHKIISRSPALDVFFIGCRAPEPRGLCTPERFRVCCVPELHLREGARGGARGVSLIRLIRFQF